MASQYVSNSISATTTASQSSAVNVEFIVLISNDSLTGDLLISLQDDVASDYITIKPGESFKNLDISVNKYWVKSSSGTVTGRFFGLQK